MAHRLRKWSLGLGAGLLLLPVLVLALALLALRVERVRTYVAARLIDLANRNMDEKLKLEGIERLNPWGVRVHHVLLLDEHGRVWVDAYGVDASINLLGLLRQHVDIGYARVDRARISVHPSLQDTTPEEEKDDDDDEPSGWKVTIPKASVGSAQLDQQSPLGALRAHAERVAGGFVWQDAYRIRVASAELSAELDGRRVLEARLRGSDWSSAQGGPVKLEGRLVNAALSAQAQLSGLDVDTPWPQGTLALALHGVNGRTLAALGLDRSWLKRAADLRLNARGDGHKLRMQGELALGATEIELAGTLDSAALALSAHVPRIKAQSISDKLPAGALAGQLDASYGFGARSAFHARWRDLIVADIQLPPGRLQGRQDGALIVIDALTLTGYEQNLSAHARIDPRREHATSTLALRGLDLGKLKVLRGEPLQGVLNGELQLSVEREQRAEPSRVAQAQPRLRLQGKLLAEHVRLRRGRAERVELQLSAHGSASAPSGQARLRVDGLSIARVPVRQLALDAQLSPQGGRARLEAHGKELEAALDLWLRKSGDVYHLNGTGRLEQKEDKLKLRVEATAGADRLTLALGLSGDGELRLRAQKSARGLSLDFSADDMDLAQLLVLGGLPKQKAELDGSGQLSIPSRRGALALTQSSYHADLSVKLPAAPLLALTTPALASLSGQIEAELRAAGTFQDPHAELELEAALSLPEREADPETLKLTASISPQASTAELLAKDLDGTLLRAQAQLGGPLREALSQLERGDSMPSFSLDVQLTPRRLDLMQGVLAYLAGVYALDVPIQLGGQLHLQAEENALRGAASLRVTLFGDAIDRSCVAGAQTELQLDADLKDKSLALRARGLGMRGGKLEAELKTHLATDDGALRLEPATLHVQGADILLPSLPGLCGLQQGKARSELNARGLGGPRPEAELTLEVRQLLGGDGPPLDVDLKGQVDRLAAQLSADVLSGHKRAAHIEAKLPLRTAVSVPEIDLDKPARAQLVLRDLPVSPFLSLGERLGRPRGSVQGDLKLSGTLRDPQVEGYLELEHVALSIASLAQPLRDVGGRIEVHGRRLSVRNLSARDRGGKLQVSGEAALGRDWSGQLSAQLNAERFPIRRQGEIVGELTTKVAFQGKLDHKLDLVGDVRIREGRFWLTGETGGKVQPLDKHGEIRFVDERGRAQTSRPAPAKKTTPKQALEPHEELSLTSLSVRSDKDIWFMHKSFSVQLGVDLKLLEEKGNEKLVGEVKIQRGHLELLGKPFEIEKGLVRLTGDYPPDPELELKAAFEPPAGEMLYVEVHGRASSPIISFSGAAETAEEAIAIVSGVGTPPAGAGQQAQSDARAFATNLTAGLLSASARRRLGDWVPLISVESDATGTPARARAGFDASKLIPPFLKPLARGAYVEGIVGNTKQRQTGSVGVGVRLEVALPRDFVTSLGYGPGPNWETDLTWVP